MLFPRHERVLEYSQYSQSTADGSRAELAGGRGRSVPPYCEYSSRDGPSACSALDAPSAADGTLPLDLARRATATARRATVVDAWRRAASGAAAKRLEQRANLIATPEKIERRQWQRRTRCVGAGGR